MRPALWTSVVLLAVVPAAATAQDVEQTVWGRRPCSPTNCPPVAPVVPGTPGMPGTPGTPGAEPNAAAQPPTTDAFAQAGEAGGMPSGSYQPAFFGDLLGYSATRVVRDARGNTHLIRPPVPVRASAIKIVDNESPRPVNRVFYTYNYWGNVNPGFNPGSPAVGLSRNMIGFEKTLFGPNASFGMRLPFITVANGFNGIGNNAVGDLSMIFKYAFLNNQQTGNLISGGLMVTVPTGNSLVIDVPNVNGVIDGTVQQTFTSVLLQPWMGYIWNPTPRIYIHGFSSLVVPTDSRDVTVLFNDVGVGFWLYRNQNDRFVQGVVPTWEFHINTPLSHRTEQFGITFVDQVNMTGGCHFIFPRSTLGIAVGFPILNPRPYDIEALASYTFRF
jgi:hypothetical protein